MTSAWSASRRRCAKARAWSSSRSGFPKRYFDVGIAEQHAVTFAAGLACEGLKPVVAIYSTFLQRAYDQLIHDVAIQNLPVVFALDRAGLVGADGATHAGAYDIAYLRCIPNMAIACPADENECRQLLSSAFEQDHPVAVRYPRGAGAGVATRPDLQALPYGKGELRRQGRGIAILAFGTLLYPALRGGRAARCHGGQHALGQAAGPGTAAAGGRPHEALVTVEDGAVMGGAGSAVGEALQAAGLVKPLLQLGLPDHVHRARRPGPPDGDAGAGRRRHRAVDQDAFHRVWSRQRVRRSRLLPDRHLPFG